MLKLWAADKSIGFSVSRSVLLIFIGALLAGGCAQKKRLNHISSPVSTIANQPSRIGWKPAGSIPTVIEPEREKVPGLDDLPSVVRHTLRDNPDIGIALAREEDERLGIEVARAAHRPSVSLRAAHGPETNITQTTRTRDIRRTEFGVDLHQTIYDFGRASGNVARRKALHNSASYRRLDKMNKIIMEVSNAYLSIIEMAEHIKIAGRNVASHKQIYAIVSASQKGGNATLADVKRVTTRLEKAKTNLIDLRSRKQEAVDEFIALSGVKPGALSSPPRFEPPLPPRGMKSAQYPDNPELLAIRADIDSLRFQSKTARANMRPTIDLDLSATLKDDAGGETGKARNYKGLISFNYKLMDGGKRFNVARQIASRILEAKHRYRKKRRNYIHELNNAIRTVRTNSQKARLLRTRVRDSKKVLELYMAQFRDGSKTVFELLDAQMDLFGAGSEKITNSYDMMRSIYEIHALRGDLIARVLR